MSDEVRRPSRRSSDNTSVVTFLHELDRQVNSLKSMQMAQDAIINHFIKDLEKLTSTVETLIHRYQSTAPASMDEVRRLSDGFKEELRDLERQLQKLINFVDQLRDQYRKIEADQTQLLKDYAVSREQMLSMESNLDRLEKSLANVQTEVTSLEESQCNLTSRFQETTTAVKTLKNALITIAAIVGFFATVLGIWQGLVK